MHLLSARPGSLKHLQRASACTERRRRRRARKAPSRREEEEQEQEMAALAPGGSMPLELGELEAN